MTFKANKTNSKKKFGSFCILYEYIHLFSYWLIFITNKCFLINTLLKNIIHSEQEYN